MTSVHTNKEEWKRFFLNFLLLNNFRFFGVQYSESGSKISLHRRPHRVRLAKIWSWIRSEFPKVPTMRGHKEQNVIYKIIALVTMP